MMFHFCSLWSYSDLPCCVADCPIGLVAFEFEAGYGNMTIRPTGFVGLMMDLLSDHPSAAKG